MRAAAGKLCVRVKTKLVLFDIDGTLLTSGGAGEKALRLALHDRFGRPLPLCIGRPITPLFDGASA